MNGIDVFAGAVWRRAARGAVLTAAVVLATGASGAADFGVEAVRIGTFSSPVHVAAAPGFPRLLFVVERPGQIQVMRDEETLAQPFLDIRDLVRGQPDPGAGGEQGLLSVAFPSNYVQSRRFYVFYTNLDGDIEIDEFKRSTERPTRADRATRRVILVIPHQGAQNHNGGQLQFGPDGLLYISTGDGANTSLPGEHARELSSLLGKILRIDPRPSATRPYRIPPGNPFVDAPGRDEIFAYGLRNPWRFAFDGTRLAIGDVGQTRREEVNMLEIDDASGVNFGWPQFEGSLVFDNSRPGPHPATPPIFEYGHNGGRCAVIGGYVVGDPDVPTLAGRYLYGDSCDGVVRGFIPNVPAQQANDNQTVDITIPGLSAFGEGFDGQLYMTQIPGGVFRLEPQAP